MILKKLRHERSWSQEQLATLSGVSVRTIQRIERGNRASFETLRSLAAVFEVSIATLQQEIVVIDKTSEKWKRLPLLFRMNFVGSSYAWLGLSRRKSWVDGEKKVAAFGLLLLCLSFFDKGFFIGGLLMLVNAYALSLVTRTADKYTVW